MKKIILGILIIVTIISMPWVLIYLGSVFEPDPKAPKITYGEFPFRIEYKINEEIFVVEDVIVCEYDGVRWNEGNGKYRAWKKTLKNSEDKDLLIFTDGDIKIYCNLGKAEYYMDDLKYSVEETHTPVFYYISSQGSGSARELIHEYKIELIDWQLSNPINNSFQ